MLKRYDAVPNTTSEESKLVDAVQIEILRYSKYAAEQNIPFSAYSRGVEKIIKALTDKLTSEPLIDRCRAILPTYALRMLARQKQLVQNYALWYGYAIMARSKNINGSKKNLKRVESNISPRLRETPLFKATLGKIPDEAYNWAVPLEQWERNYTKTIERLMRDLIYSDAKEDYSTNVNLRNIAEMTVRYERQKERLAELETEGVKLVWIEPHANCSERCEKYQGKLYSLDGTTGKIDGISYRPLTYATDNPVDLYVTKAGKVYQNGCITGFNCRHKLIPYSKGNKPDTIPAEVIERRRDIETRQREMERDIRAQKRKAVLMKNISPKAYRDASEKAKEMMKQYEAFSRKNKVAFSYERTSIFTDELGKALYENLADQYIPH